MKIAIQMFGHLRTYQQCHEALKKNLLDLYDCDIFIHTWDSLDHNTQTWHDFRMPNAGQSEDNIEQIIQDVYHPKAFKVEKQIVKDEGYIDVSTDNKKISFFGMKSMFYSMKEADALRRSYQKEHNIQYDYVIVIRPDICLYQPFNIEKYLIFENGTDQLLYTVGKYKSDVILNDYRKVGCSDLFFFATPQIINQVYDNTDKILNQIKNGQTTQWGPEYSFIYTLQSLNIHPLLVNYLETQNFEIIRWKGSAATKSIFHKPIRIHIKHGKIEILILSNLKHLIFDLNIKLLFISLHICLGKYKKNKHSI